MREAVTPARALLFAPPNAHGGAQLRVLLSAFRDGKPCIEFRLYTRNHGKLAATRTGLALSLREFDAIVRLVRGAISEETECAA